MKDFPAAFIVLREETDKYSYPLASKISRLFTFLIKQDHDNKVGEDFSSTWDMNVNVNGNGNTNCSLENNSNSENEFGYEGCDSTQINCFR